MLTQTTLSQLLFHYPAIHKLPANLQQLVCQTAVATKLPAQQILFNEGDACLNFVMPLSGSVRVVKPDLSGRELLLYRIRPGDSCILTVSCLLGNQKYNARGIVDRPVTAVCALPGGGWLTAVTDQLLYADHEGRWAALENGLSGEVVVSLQVVGKQIMAGTADGKVWFSSLNGLT